MGRALKSSAASPTRRHRVLSSPSALSPLSDSLFKTDRRSVVFIRRKVWNPVEPGFGVKRDRFGLLVSSLEPHRVIPKIARQSFEFVQDHCGNPMASLFTNHECPFDLHPELVYRDERAAGDGVTVASGDEENASRDRNQRWIEDSDICRRKIIAVFNIIDECG